MEADFAGERGQMGNTRTGGVCGKPVGSSQLIRASPGHEAQPPLDRLPEALLKHVPPTGVFWKSER